MKLRGDQSHTSRDGDYPEMKKILKKRPEVLLAMLQAHLGDLEIQAEFAEGPADKKRIEERISAVEAAMNTANARLAAAKHSSGLGFSRPTQDASEEDLASNPVSMNARLRREMGPGAADFLDEYALAIHRKTIEFFTDIKTKALNLGDENPDDGVTSLREKLLSEVGRRGLKAVEPLFEEWRSQVMKQVSKDLRDMYAPPEEDVELEDDQVSHLLGLDSMDDDLDGGQDDEQDEESESDEPDDDESSDQDQDKGDSPDQDISSDQDNQGEEGGDEESDEEPTVEASFIRVARGPVSGTVGMRTSASATAALTTEAIPEQSTQDPPRDFTPSGYRSPTLE